MPAKSSQREYTAWHFLPEDKRLRYGDGRVVRAGRTYRYKGTEPLAMCEFGMHGSVRAIDALKYAPGPIVCRVVISGDVIVDSDKIVGRARHVIWMADATSVLHEFACRVAEDALKAGNVTDERCWKAIHAKREWLAGRATDAELAAARSAAWAAASDAAWAAASDAAWAAAWAAASDAAWDAASDAAWAAARAAASDAARAAAWDAQNRRLTSMLFALKPETVT